MTGAEQERLRAVAGGSAAWQAWGTVPRRTAVGDGARAGATVSFSTSISPETRGRDSEPAIRPAGPVSWRGEWRSSKPARVSAASDAKPRGSFGSNDSELVLVAWMTDSRRRNQILGRRPISK